MPRGAKRFEVSSTTIHFASSFCIGTSSVSSFNSRFAPAPLHFIRKSRSNFYSSKCEPSLPFFHSGKKIVQGTKNCTTQIRAPGVGQKKMGRRIITSHAPSLFIVSELHSPHILVDRMQSVLLVLSLAI